jgi:hypothetical protein
MKETTMTRRTKSLFIPLMVLALALSCLPLYAANHEGHHMMAEAGGAGSGQGPAFAPMAEPGRKVALGKDGYLIYGFDKKPKMGTVIMKVEIYSADGKRDTSLELLGDSGMPSMRGAHETGDQPFKLSRKGEYLLPVNIVMPGDWEVRLTVKKGGQVIFRGRYNFDV